MSTPDWNDEVWNAAVRYVGTSRNTDEERRLVARVIRAERALAADRVKQLEEALSDCLSSLEHHYKQSYSDWDGNAHPTSTIGRARALLNGGSNERA